MHRPRSARVVVTGAGSYLRLIDVCITQLKAQGPSRTCNESEEEEEEPRGGGEATITSAPLEAYSRTWVTGVRICPPQDPTALE